MTKMPKKIIYTKRVAYQLRKWGFPIVKVDINPNKPQFDCYLFEDTEELQKALTAITQQK